MTLLHQAAQKAVEALRKIAKPGYGLEFGDSDTERADYWHGVAASCRRQASAIAESLESALQQQPEPVASIVYEAYSKTGSYLFASEEGADEFASRFPATAAMSMRARPIIGAALQQQEVPSDKQIARAFADEQMRQGSGTHNRHEWFRRGALWAASPSTTQQHEVGSELVIGSSGSDWIAVGGFRFDRDAGWQQVAAEYANNPDVTTLYRKRSERATAPCTPENAEKDTSNGAGGWSSGPPECRRPLAVAGGRKGSRHHAPAV